MRKYPSEYHLVIVNPFPSRITEGAKPFGKPPVQPRYHQSRATAPKSEAKTKLGSGRNAGAAGTVKKGQSARGTAPSPQINVNIHGNINIQSHIVLLPATQHQKAVPMRKVAPKTRAAAEAELEGKTPDDSPQLLTPPRSPTVKIAYFSKK